MIMIVMIIIIVQCCHIVSLWLSWSEKIQECHLYLASPLPRSFEHIFRLGTQGCFTGQGSAGNPPFPTGRVPCRAGRPSLILSSYHATQTHHHVAFGNSVISNKFHFGTEECLWSYWTLVILRPLKVEIHRSTVSTDGLHSKSIIEQQS